MQRNSFSIFIAALSAIFIFGLSVSIKSQTKNNLVPSSDAASANSAATNDNGKSASTRPGDKVLGKQPDKSLELDPSKIKDLSDKDLDDVFNNMSARFSNDPVTFNNIGASYFERKTYDKSETALRHAIALNNHPAFLTNLSIVYDVQGKKSEATTMAQRAVAQAPRYYRARSQLCQLTMDSKRDADTVACFEEMSKFTQLDPLDQTYYALVLMRCHELDKAISILTPLVQGPQPTALMLNTLGNAYYYKKRYSKAADAFKRGTEIDPDNAELRFNLAISLTAVNNREGALSQYDLMKDHNPKLAEQLYRYLYRDKIIFVDQQGASKTP